MPCSARPPCEFSAVPLEDISIIWGGPAVGRKALAYPARKTIYIDPDFWASIRTVDGRAAILAHERAHLEGARCESCADTRGGAILKREGMEVPRDAARALAGRLENRDGQQAADDLLKGFGWSTGFGIDGERSYPARTATGYDNGRAFELALAEVRPGVWVASSAAPSLDDALTECEGANCAPTRISYAFRTMEEQTAEWNAYQAKLLAWEASGRSGAKPTPAARPGYSTHQRGKSIDASFASDSARELAAEIFAGHGWERDVASERWHFTHGGLRRYIAPAVVAGVLILAALVTLK